MAKALNKKLFQMIVSRCNEQGYTGKKRDAMVIEMLAGALAAIASLSDLNMCDLSGEYQHLESVAFFIIAPRGFKELERMANALDEPAKQEQHFTA